jgi:hypothetical protein
VIVSHVNYFYLVTSSSMISTLNNSLNVCVTVFDNSLNM